MKVRDYAGEVGQSKIPKECEKVGKGVEVEGKSFVKKCKEAEGRRRKK